jgi:hypothetical protein
MMKLKEMQDGRLEKAEADALAKHLSECGWDVWTDFRFAVGDKRTLHFDLFARKGRDVTVYEFVTPGRGDHASRKRSELRKVAEENGWRFELREIGSLPEAILPDDEALEQLALQLQQLHASADAVQGVQRAALIAYSLLTADRLAELLLAAASRQHGGIAGDMFEASRKLIDTSVLADADLERLNRLRKLRNEAVHNLVVPQLTNDELSSIVAFVLGLVARLRGHPA